MKNNQTHDLSAHLQSISYLYQQEKAPNILMVTNDSCLQKGSSVDNSKILYNPEKDAETNSKPKLEEVKKVLLAKKETVIWNHVDLVEDFLLTGIDKSTFSHTGTVLGIIRKLLGEHPDYPDILHPDFAEKVLMSIPKSGSLQRRKVILLNFYNFLWRQTGTSNLEPSKNAILRLLKSRVSVPVGHKTEKPCHPAIFSFLCYLTEKNQKWHKGARQRTTVFLKWLTDSGLVPETDPVQINLRRITTDILQQYRRHLESKVLEGTFAPSSAQLHIQSLRKWFDFLQLSGVIWVNPYHLKNFKVQRREDYNLLRLNEVASFFRSIFAHSKDVLSDVSLYFTLAGIAARASETLAVNWSDINLITGEIKLNRKWKGEQVLPLPGPTWLVLELHFKSIKPEPNTPVWKNVYGTRLAYATARKRFHKFMRLGGITEDVGACHFLRHLLLSELCLDNQELETIKTLAGHKTIAHLNPYIHSRDADIMQKMDKITVVGGNLYEQWISRTH